MAGTLISLLCVTGLALCPALAATGRLEVTVAAEDGTPLPCRVHLTAAGTPVYAPGLPAWRRDPQFCCPGRFAVDLPAGKASLRIERGPEYVPHVSRPAIEAGKTTPLAVTLSPADAMLGDGWELILSRTFGEFYLRQYLLTQLGASLAEQATTGWGGDRFALYHHPDTDQLAWVMQIVWDTDAEAVEFAYAFDLFVDIRYPLAGPNSDCFLSDEDALCTITEGDTTYLAYAVDVELAEGLLASQR